MVGVSKDDGGCKGKVEIKQFMELRFHNRMNKRWEGKFPKKTREEPKKKTYKNKVEFAITNKVSSK